RLRDAVHPIIATGRGLGPQARLPDRLAECPSFGVGEQQADHGRPGEREPLDGLLGVPRRVRLGVEAGLVLARRDLTDDRPQPSADGLLLLSDNDLAQPLNVIDQLLAILVTVQLLTDEKTDLGGSDPTHDPSSPKMTTRPA